MSLRKIKTFPLLFVFLPFSLCSCSKSPITFFNSFSRYVSEDGVMILECQLNKKSGFGKLKIDNKYEMFEWGSDWDGCGLWARAGEKFFLSFSIEFPKNYGFTLTRNEITISRDHLNGHMNDLPEPANWTSTISKEKDLSDEEIDARYCTNVLFENKDLNFRFYLDKIGVLLDGKFTFILNEDNTFYLKRDYAKRGEGTYQTTKDCLYLSFVRDDLFNSAGETVPFKMIDRD